MFLQSGAVLYLERDSKAIGLLKVKSHLVQPWVRYPRANPKKVWKLHENPAFVEDFRRETMVFPHLCWFTLENSGGKRCHWDGLCMGLPHHR